jgi:predicted nucleic acid-binding protein
MRADYRVVLDACVLIPMPLADTLLRMAEEPRLYLPKWSQTIMDEVTRNLIAKWQLEPEKARRREMQLRRHFPEAWVEGFEALTDAMTNDPGDRHVLAAAVRVHADLIVTYNRRHFPATSLKPWEIDVQGPSAFLRGLYDLDAGLFVGKLHEQAAAIGVSLPRLLRSLSKNVPQFVDYFCEEQGIDLSGEQQGASQ